MKRAAVLFAVLIAALAWPQTQAPTAQYDPPFPKEEFARRRADLMERVGPNLIVLFGAPYNDTWRRFRQYNDFYYLSGVESPNALMILDGKTKTSYLFLVAGYEWMDRVDGPALRPAEGVAELTGFDEALPVSRFETKLTELAKDHTEVFLYLGRNELNAQSQDRHAGASPSDRKFPADSRPSREAQFRADIEQRFPGLKVQLVHPHIFEMRRVKSPAEIEKMREAAELTAKAMHNAISATKPGVYEYELEAEVVAEFARHRAMGAWDPIVASGPNANILHWMENTRRMEAGDIVLVDAGCDKDYYCSDVTRTWPVSGEGSEEFRRVYQACLEAHKAMIAALKPGASVRDLARAMNEVWDKYDLADYGARNPGHYTGMAPHDVGNSLQPFEKGVVFNVEPYVDIPDKGIHIRFEDTCAVTEDGCAVLSKTPDLPWELDELIAIRDGKAK